MALIAYDRVDAAAFAATRHLSEGAAAGWRAAVARQLAPRAGMRLLDVGAGTGSWAQAFARWFPGLDVLAVEPSAAMRERCAHRPLVGGDVTAVPLRAASADGAWLSTVLHHVPDLGAAARELRRVVRPGAPVLIRSVFAGRPDGVTLISDDAYAAGRCRLRAAARTGTGPVVDALDLVVLR